MGVPCRRQGCERERTPKGAYCSFTCFHLNATLQMLSAELKASANPQALAPVWVELVSVADLLTEARARAGQ